MNMYVEIMISGYMLLMLFFFMYLNKRIRKKQVSDSYLGILTELYKTPAVKFSHELVDSIGFRINYLFYRISRKTSSFRWRMKGREIEIS